MPGGDFQVAGDSGGGSGASIFYSLSGPESEIAPAAEKVAQFLRSTPGSVNVQTSNEAAAPRLNVNIDPQKAEILGVSPSTAANAARLAIDGAVATRVRAENGLVDVRVQFPLTDRKTVDQLARRARPGGGWHARTPLRHREPPVDEGTAANQAPEPAAGGRRLRRHSAGLLARRGGRPAREGASPARFPAGRRPAHRAGRYAIHERDDGEHGHRAADVLHAGLHADGDPLRFVPRAADRHALRAACDYRCARLRSRSCTAWSRMPVSRSTSSR